MFSYWCQLIFFSRALGPIVSSQFVDVCIMTFLSVLDTTGCVSSDCTS